MAKYVELDSVPPLASVVGYRSSPAAGHRSQLIERTPHATPTLVQHVAVDHRRRHIAASQQFLDRPYVTGIICDF
jgi:hypothetical protein